MDHPDVLLGVVLLVLHLAVLIHAISNRHPWWALAIFFFPLVGDLAYVIYYSSTRERPNDERTVDPSGSVRLGQTVVARFRLYDKLGRLSMKKGDRAVVTKIQGWPRYLTLRLPDGRERHGFHASAFTVHRSAGASQAPTSGPAPGFLLERAEDDSTGQSSAPPGSTALREQLEELATLQKDGLISDEELSAKRRQLLGLE